MKKGFVFLLGVSWLFGASITTHAEEQGKTEMSTAVSEGDFKVTVPKGSLNFEKLEPVMKSYTGERQVLYAEIGWEDFYYSESSGADYLGNPYSPEYTVINSPGTTKLMPSMLTIENTDFTVTQFDVKLSRTPFVSQSGKEMSGEQLYMGAFKDNGHFDKVENQYSLVEYVTVTSEASVVASYNGTAAKGSHAISPLSRKSKEVAVIENPITESPYETEKNIQLVVDSQTVIPEAGNYSANLLWSIEVTP